MEAEQRVNRSNHQLDSPVLTLRKALVRELSNLSGSKIVDRILEQANPRGFVQTLPYEDLFWLVKRIGEDDCVPLLELASPEQWQYLLDLETWNKDQVDVLQSVRWLHRLFKADSRRLVSWLFSDDGESFTYFLLRRTVQVILKAPDEEFEIPDGFFSFDGVSFIRITASEHHEAIDKLIQAIAERDYKRYLGLMAELDTVIAAETEEELYRLRNVRLAEHGFLPYDEAAEIYAPLAPEKVMGEKLAQPPERVFEEETLALVPVTPWYLAGAKNTFAAALSAVNEPLLRERIELEFAVLCNKIISADGMVVREPEALVATFRKAAGYLNVGMEKLWGNEVSRALNLLRSHPLESFFRVGFGLALTLKWKAQRWVKQSWFHVRGLTAGFWGDYWGGMLAGLLKQKPLFFVGAQGGKEYRDFERLSEVEEGHLVVCRLTMLDRLIARLGELGPLDERFLQATALTYRSFLFTFWARSVLSLQPGFSEITLEQARIFFSRLRGGRAKPPYTMPGGEETFLRNFLAHAPLYTPEDVSILKDTLLLIWNEFCEEYERISVEDLDPRYSRFIAIAS